MDSMGAASAMNSGLNLQTTVLIILFGSTLLHVSYGYDEATQYLGCFVEFGVEYNHNDSYRILKHQIHVPSITIDKCLDACKTDGFTFAGLQSGNACFCGHQYYGKKGFACNRPCSGNGQQICGGDWENSIYSVCPNGTYGSNCNLYCNCFNRKGLSPRCNINTGVCIPNVNECEDTSISSVCKHATCNDTNIGYDCVCDRGYEPTKDHVYGKCTAINGIPPYAVCMVFIAIVTPISIALNVALMQLHKHLEKKETEKRAMKAEQERMAEARGYVNSGHDVNDNEADQPHLYKKLHQRPVSHTDA